MADETLITSVPSATKIRTDDARFNVGYSLIDANGNKVGQTSVSFKANDAGLTQNQKDTIVTFARNVLVVKGLIS